MGSSRPACGSWLMLLFLAPAGLAQWCPMPCPAERDMQSAGAFLVLRKEEQRKAQRAVEEACRDLLSNSSAFNPPGVGWPGQTVVSCQRGHERRAGGTKPPKHRALHQTPAGLAQGTCLWEVVKKSAVFSSAEIPGTLVVYLVPGQAPRILRSLHS